MTATPGGVNTMAVARDGAAAEPVPSGQGWYTQLFSATGHVRAPVVFAGFGMSAPGLGYDDYSRWPRKQ